VEVQDHHTLLCGRNAKFNWCGQSFYGSLGFSLALFNDFAEADRVAATGQELLRRIIGLIRRDGGQVVEVDTDGVLFVPPPGVEGEDAERAFLAGLNAEMPEGIRIGFDGRFRMMLSYKKKNYALLGYDDRLKFKGSSLVSRSIERFGRRFVRRAVERLLAEDVQGLHDLYLETRERVLTHAWKDVKQFSRTETLKETVEQYLADVEAGRRPRAAAYELAIAHARQTGRPPRKGDRISFYITGTSAGVTSFENCRLADAWDPARPDENAAYYLKRLDEFAAKFEPFFTPHDFRLIFSPEDLFGFSPAGIRILRQERPPGEAEDEVPF
jgi:DNA polymerase elongation subunit (family B)